MVILRKENMSDTKLDMLSAMQMNRKERRRLAKKNMMGKIVGTNKPMVKVVRS